MRSTLGGVLLAGVLVAIPLWRMERASRENRFDALILRAAGENGCDPALIKAVVWRESGFNPDVHGKDGELGLMQVMPEVAREWAQSQGMQDAPPETLILNPAVNLRIGSWYLSRALQQWSHAAEPMPPALAQYNAGRSKVLKWAPDANALADAEAFLARVQFPSTRAYVRDILQRHQHYRRRGEF